MDFADWVRLIYMDGQDVQDSRIFMIELSGQPQGLPLTVAGLSIIWTTVNERHRNASSIGVRSSFDKLRMTGLPCHRGIIERPCYTVAAVFAGIADGLWTTHGYENGYFHNNDNLPRNRLPPGQVFNSRLVIKGASRFRVCHRGPAVNNSIGDRPHPNPLPEGEGTIKRPWPPGNPLFLAGPFWGIMAEDHQAQM